MTAKDSQIPTILQMSGLWGRCPLYGHPDDGKGPGKKERTYKTKKATP